MTRYAKASKKYYYSNLEKERKRARDAYSKRRQRALLKEFNLTIEQYDNMSLKQLGLCAVCKQPETQVYRSSGRVRSLAVDHCHITGKIRKLLCGNCNAALGMLKENSKTIQSLLEYCNEYKS